MNQTEKPERYRHTQVGTVMLATLGVGVLLIAVISIGTIEDPRVPRVVVLCMEGVLVAGMILFATLTVVVRGDEVEIRFGPGLIRKCWPLREFTSVQAVRNRWWYGLGIHWIGRGWLYNVSGLDAVELERKDGRVVRIGTDEPEALEAALRDAIAAERSDAERPPT